MKFVHNLEAMVGLGGISAWRDLSLRTRGTNITIRMSNTAYGFLVLILFGATFIFYKLQQIEPGAGEFFASYAYYGGSTLAAVSVLAITRYLAWPRRVVLNRSRGQIECYVGSGPPRHVFTTDQVEDVRLQWVWYHSDNAKTKNYYVVLALKEGEDCLLCLTAYEETARDIQQHVCNLLNLRCNDDIHYYD